MAEVLAAFNQIDPESANLIFQLQLEDVQDLQTSSKDKNRDGELSDAQVALSMLQQNLECIQNVLSDRLMTQRIADAVQADAEVITHLVGEEKEASDDHALAHELNGSAIAPETPLGTATLNEKILAKLAGQYVSDFSGIELLGDKTSYNSNDQEGHIRAESSAQASRRGPQLSKPRPLECVACRETKNYFDVIEVPCGDGYCKSCLRELIDSVTKDESLFPPRCCRQPFDMNEVKVFLNRELRDQFERAKVEFGTRNKTYCSLKSCSAFIPPSIIEGDAATCHNCGTATCVICKDGAHEGDCPADPDVSKTLELAAESGWQSCYACHRVIELDTGCYHMTCRCGAQFCYLCGDRWKTCGCVQWDENRLERRANVLANRAAPNLAQNDPRLLQRVEEAANMLRDRHEYRDDITAKNAIRLFRATSSNVVSVVFGLAIGAGGTGYNEYS